MDEYSNLVFSSAVLCLSPTTEVARNRAVDTIVIQSVVNKGINAEFTIKEVYNTLQQEIPLRHDEVRKSILRGLKSKTLVISDGDVKSIDSAVLRLSSRLSSELQSESDKINEFLCEATRELFEDILDQIELTKLENLLLDCLSRLMAHYGYAYAGQMTGILEASEFVPMDVLREVCQSAIQANDMSESVISTEMLMDGIGTLFDRRDPCLNNLAFCLCQRYYAARLIGLDMPMDFLSSQLYKDSTIFFDTNFILTVVFSKPGHHNEFKGILDFAPSLGITFAASELSIAESLKCTSDYGELLDRGEEIVPQRLLQEAEEDILEAAEGLGKEERLKPPVDTRSAQRLKEIGVKVIALKDTSLLEDKEELEKIKAELHEFDKRYRKARSTKDDGALYHDAQLYHIVKTNRDETDRANSSWFLTEDNSIIAYGISKQSEGKPPYSIKLPTLLHTLSPFIESQALKVDFADLFMNLISRDLLPKECLFTSDDLKMFVGFDIKARAIPPEFIRKGIAHIKREILKGGGLTEDNKAQVLYEFNKYISTPDTNLLELQRRFERKIQARDDDLKKQELETSRLENKIKNRDRVIALLVGAFLSVLLWIGYFSFYDVLLEIVKRPPFIAAAIQLALISASILVVFPERAKLVAIAGAVLTIASVIASLA